MDKSILGTGSLYIVATPIGNIEDMTYRAVKVLKAVDLIAAEDTRITQRLLNYYAIKKPLTSYHEYNEAERSPHLLRQLIKGSSIALVTSAGTPMVSDPGYRVITTAIEHGIKIIPIPGVSAAITALSASGLPTDTFMFLGFLPRKKAKRQAEIQNCASINQTIIIYESPKRIIPLIETLIEILGDRNGVLAREMTKRHEEFIRGPLSYIRQSLMDKPTIKGECTLLLHGKKNQNSVSDEDLAHIIKNELDAGAHHLKQLSATIASTYGIPRNRIYNIALRVKKAQDS